MSITNKPYAVLAGFTYYPSPGLKGYVDSFETIEKASEAGKEFQLKELSDCGWWQVVDLRDCKIVAGEGYGHTGLWGMVSAFE